MKFQVLKQSYLGMPLLQLINVRATLFPTTAKVVQTVVFVTIFLVFFSESSALSQIPRILGRKHEMLKLSSHTY